MEQIFLQDNIRISIYNTEKFKSETFGVYFSIKADKKKIVERNLLSSILKRGCEGYPSIKEINERLDELYATIISSKTRKIGDYWYFGINADMVGNDYTEGEDVFSGVADMIKRILFCPIFENGKFKKEYVKSEIELYRSLVLSQINSPRSYAMLRCHEHTLKDRDDILSLEEIIERLSKIKNKDIVDFYNFVLENAGLEIFYVGNRTNDEIISYCKEYSKYIKPNKLFLPNAHKILLDSNKVKEIFEEKPISQGRIAISIDTKTFNFDKDYYSVVLFNEIFGGSPVSKLFMNVREKLSLCYECSSSYDSKEGIIYINSGIDIKNFELAKKAILNEYESMKKGEITPDELDSAKKSLCNLKKSVLDSAQQIENEEFTRMLINGIDDIDTFTDKVKKVEISDIVEVSKKFLINTVYFLSGNGKGSEVNDDEE